jgi:hypothetical protein
MKEEIKAWLQGPREYLQGIALYDRYGYNKMLKNVFSRVETVANRQILEYELGKLVGIDEQELKTMVRVAKKEIVPTNTIEKPKTYVDDLLLQLAGQFNVSVDDLFGGQLAMPLTDAQEKAFKALEPAYEQVPELMKKVIRIREVYPFLKDVNCPNELKIMVADMFSAYDRYRDAYALLSPENPNADNLALAKEVVENYLDNRAMWEELDYYKENGELLGKHPVFELLNLKNEIKAMSDIEVMKAFNNSKSNVTKSNNALAKAVTDEEKAEANERISKWTLRKKELETELESRKK